MSELRYSPPLTASDLEEMLTSDYFKLMTGEEYRRPWPPTSFGVEFIDPHILERRARRALMRRLLYGPPLPPEATVAAVLARDRRLACDRCGGRL